MWPSNSATVYNLDVLQVHFTYCKAFKNNFPYNYAALDHDCYRPDDSFADYRYRRSVTWPRVDLEDVQS